MAAVGSGSERGLYEPRLVRNSMHSNRRAQPRQCTSDRAPDPLVRNAAEAASGIGPIQDEQTEVESTEDESVCRSNEQTA